jgi:glucose-1-phosphate cytidylyltransferase
MNEGVRVVPAPKSIDGAPITQVDRQCRQRLSAIRLKARDIAVDGYHFVAAFEEAGDNRTTDETRRTGHKNSHLGWLDRYLHLEGNARYKAPPMKVVILCGGMGTRIRDANENLPKPMLPIGGRPILWHIMKGYASKGFQDFVLCLGYKGWVIKEFFLNYRSMTSDLRVTLGTHGGTEVLTPSSEDGWRVTLADTGEATMTGGRLSSVRRYVEEDDLLMCTYGDGVADLDIKELLSFHRKHGKIATVTAVRPPGRFGELAIEKNVVSEFNEKPQASGGFINGGFFVFDAKRIWDYIALGAGTVLESEPMRHLARDGQLAAYEHPGFWQPMDTLREYNLLNEMWASGKAPWKVWT